MTTSTSVSLLRSDTDDRQQLRPHHLPRWRLGDAAGRPARRSHGGAARRRLSAGRLGCQLGQPTRGGFPRLDVNWRGDRRQLEMQLTDCESVG